MSSGPVVLAVIVVAGGLLWKQFQHRLRASAAGAVTAQQGLRHRPGSSDAPSLPFRQFQNGMLHKIRNQMWSDDAPNASVFEHHWTRMGNGRTDTFRTTCAVYPLPFIARSTTLSPQGWVADIAASFGAADIVIGQQEFDARYVVQSNDEVFARTLLDQRLVGFLLRGEPVEGHQVHVELEGAMMLVWISRYIEAHQLPDLLAWGHALIEQMPSVLAERYR